MTAPRRITARHLAHDDVARAREVTPAHAATAGPRQDWTDAYLARVMKHDDADAWVPHALGNGRTVWKPRTSG